MGQARGEAGRDRVAGIGHHDRDFAGAFFGGGCRGIALRDDHVDAAGHQLVDQPWQAVGSALGGAAFEDDVAVHRIAALGKVEDHSGTQNPIVGRAYRDQPDAIDFAGLGECAHLQQPHSGGCEDGTSENYQSEDHLEFGAA